MYSRIISDKILNSLSSHEIIFLLGTRQVGKTTLTKMTMDAYKIEPKQKIYYDLEDGSKRQLFENASVAQIKRALKLDGVDADKDALVCFDEVQKLKDPSNLLKLIHDHLPSVRVVATGNSSLEIKRKFSDSLAGRKRVFGVEPLSFDEFLIFQEHKRLINFKQMFAEVDDKLSLKPMVDALSKEFLSAFHEYLLFGGYPEVVLLSSKEEKITKLKSIIGSYVNKDIRDVANIENVEAYNNLLKYISINTCGTFNSASVSKDIKVALNTLSRYVQILKDTFIIGELSPFFTNKNNEISKNKKLFFKDLGSRNLQISSFTALGDRVDSGALYENYVYNRLAGKLWAAESLHFYRTQSKTEIDFVKVSEDGLSIFDVKAGSHTQTPKAFGEFATKYADKNIKNMTVINRDIFDYRNGVWFMPAYLY